MKYQRQIDLLQYINNKGTVSIAELLEHFHISKATLNRDLTDLEKEDSIRKVHGGVVSNLPMQTFELPINKKEHYNKDYKEAIARKAVQLIQSNQSIILDSGSTIWYLAKELVKRRDIENLTVITCDLKVAYTLAEAENDNISLFVLGGMKHKDSFDLYGPTIVEILKSLNVDLYFMGVAAFDNKTGITHTYLDDVSTKKAMIQCARKVVLCADSSKYGLVKRWSICNINDINMIITDNHLTLEALNEINELCSDVDLVNE